MSAAENTLTLKVGATLDTTSIADELERVGRAFIAAAHQIRGEQAAPSAAASVVDAG